jgi:hypothetical protein
LGDAVTLGIHVADTILGPDVTLFGDASKPLHRLHIVVGYRLFLVRFLGDHRLGGHQEGGGATPWLALKSLSFNVPPFVAFLGIPV